MKKLLVNNTITIDAPREQVWEVLTQSNYTKIYMFGCETVSEWRQGSPLIWRMIHEEKEFIPVKGEILEIDAPHLLKYSVIDPNAAYPDFPENHLYVTYILEEKDGGTILTVSQDGFEGAADGDKRYKDVYNNGEGWNPILVQVKDLAEQKSERRD